MQRLPRIIGLVFVFLATFLIATNIFIFTKTQPYIYNDTATPPKAEVALIPGAPLLATGVLSPIFIDRVDAAIALYQAGKVKKILASGDNSTVSHNEVNPVRTYLLQKGIPDQDIFLDHAGFDTYSSLYRARDIFGVTSVIIASQSFHLPRAVYIARQLGLEAYGVKADVGNSLWSNYEREVFANEKAVFDLLFNTKPKYLGAPIPIEGDGRLYP